PPAASDRLAPAFGLSRVPVKTHGNQTFPPNKPATLCPVQTARCRRQPGRDKGREKQTLLIELGEDPNDSRHSEKFIRRSRTAATRQENNKAQAPARRLHFIQAIFSSIPGLKPGC